jgi:hypothetical protein
MAVSLCLSMGQAPVVWPFPEISLSKIAAPRYLLGRPSFSAQALDNAPRRGRYNLESMLRISGIAIPIAYRRVSRGLKERGLLLVQMRERSNMRDGLWIGHFDRMQNLSGSPVDSAPAAMGHIPIRERGGWKRATTLLDDGVLKLLS